MTRMLAPDISTWPDHDPQLIGSRCADCGATTFPTQAFCPRCSGEAMSDLLLPRRGTLVAWTTQGFLPGRPYAGSETAETFEPFGMGLVQLGDVIKVEGRLTEGDPEKLRFGMEVELTMRPLYTDDDGDEVLMFAFAPVTASRGERFMNDVAIIGVGLHPFGRFGDKTAMAMGAEAIRLALSDAGASWRDIQFGVGGSHTVTNPNAVSSLVGLSGIPFTDVFNACATSASAIQVAADAIRAGRADVAIAFGMDKHPRGAFVGDPANLALPKWYGENGQYITTKFFGMNANRYCHEHGISSATLAKVAAKNYRNGALNPNAFRREPISEEEILASRMVNYPLTQYMFCAPDEGAAAAVLCRADLADRFTSTPVFVRATEIRSRSYGAYEVHATYAAVEEDEPPTTRAARAAFESAGIAPDGRRRDPAPGHRGRRRGHRHGRGRLLCTRRPGEAPRRRRNRDRRPHAHQHRRRSHRQRRADRRLGAAAGPRARAAAPRGGGRPPGARQPPGRLRPGLRRSGHRGGHDPVEVAPSSAHPTARRYVRPLLGSCG